MKYNIKKWCKYLKKSEDSRYVAKIILFVGDKILFLISDIERFKGNLDLPGGHVHHGEDLIVALKREVKEETGLSIKNPTIFRHEDDITYYYSKLSSDRVKNIKLSFEHSEYKLLTLDQVQKEKYPITPNFLKAAKDAIALKDKNKFDPIGLIQSIAFFSALVWLVKGLYS